MAGISRAQPITGAGGRELERHVQGIPLWLRYNECGISKHSREERPRGGAFAGNSGTEFGAQGCCSRDLKGPSVMLCPTREGGEPLSWGVRGAAVWGSPRAFLLEGTVLPITSSQPPHAAVLHAGITGGF